MPSAPLLTLRRLVCCTVAAVVIVAGGCLGPAAAATSGEAAPVRMEPAADVDEQWWTLELAGERIGWVQQEVAPADFAGAPAERSRNQTWARMARSNGGTVETLVTSSRLDWFSDAKGAALGFESEVDQAGAVVTTRGVIREASAVASAGASPVGQAIAPGRVLRLAITTPDGVRESEVPWDETVLSPVALEAEVLSLLERGVGETTVTTFSAEAGNTVLTLRLRVKGEAVLPLGAPLGGGRLAGAADRGLLVEQEMLGLGLTTREIWTRDGRMLRQELGPLVLVAAPREEALAPLVDSLAPFAALTATLFGAPPELRGMRHASFEIVPRKSANGGVGDVWGGGNVDVELFPEDGRQRWTGSGETRRLQVDVSRPVAGAPPSLAEKAPSSLLESDDPEIVAVARAVVAKLPPEQRGDATARARALERWVHHEVGFKGSGIGLASAKQTLRTRDGDCTEHAALLAALLRAVEVPSRLVVGLVGAPANTPTSNGDAARSNDAAMVPHAWVEAWDGAHWLPLDAAVYADGGPVDATHLVLGRSSGADIGAMLDLALPVVRGLGRFDLRFDSAAAD